MAENPANRLRDKNAKLEATLIQAFTDLHDRLSRSEAVVATLQSGQTAAVDSLVAQITSNFSQLFTEANATVTEIQNGEFVKAASLTPVIFTEGLEITITLDENEGLPFIPSSVVALHSDSPDDYAFARVDSYSSSTRILEGTIFLAVGEVGPHTDVQVEIGALSTLAQRTLLAQAEAARDATALLKQAAADWAEKATGEDVDGVGTRSAKHHAGVAGSAAVAAGSAAGAAGESATLAGQHRDKAGQWADADEDVEVEAGKFSARHHAAKAIAAAIAAATFDPSSYYPKTETFTRAEINAAIAAAIDALVGDAPGALDTLNELAAALADDADFAATVTAALASKAPQATTYTKTETDSLLSAINTTSLDRDIRYLALMFAEALGDRRNMEDGIADPFNDETDVDLASSTGSIAYDGVNDRYSAATPVTYSADLTTTGAAISSGEYFANAASRAFDNSTSLQWTSSQSSTGVSGVAYIGQDFGAGNNKAISRVTVKQGSNSATRITSAILQYSDNGSAWSNASTLTLPNDEAVNTFDIPYAGGHRYWRLLANSNPTSNWGVVEFEMLERDPFSAISLRSDAFTADAPPSQAYLAVQANAAVTIVPQTNLSGYVSRDGGTTWTQVTLTLTETLADGTSMYQGAADISGQPSGTAMKWRVDTPSSPVPVYVSGIVFQWRT